MPSKPVFVLVHGAWHRASTWDLVINILTAQGYECHAVNLPSVDAHPPVRSIDADVDTVRKAISAAVDAGKDVILVMHSYGGVPGQEAMKDFVSPSEGKGKVLRMVYITSFCLLVGESIHLFLQQVWPDWASASDDELVVTRARDTFYNDLSDDEIEARINDIGVQSIAPLQSPMTSEAWKAIPTAYLMCEKDNAIPIQAQELMVARSRELVPSVFDMVERFDSSHSPFFSQPEKTTEFLIKAAGGAKISL